MKLGVKRKYLFNCPKGKNKNSYKAGNEEI